MAAEVNVTVTSAEVQAALERLRESLGGTISVEIGTNVVYGAIHHFGGKAGRGRRSTIHARPFMPVAKDGDELNRADANELTTIINDHLARAWGGDHPTAHDVSRAIGRYFKTSVQLRFRAQAAPDGTRWRPTQRGGQILRLTGRLRNSITYRAG